MRGMLEKNPPSQVVIQVDVMPEEGRTGVLLVLRLEISPCPFQPMMAYKSAVRRPRLTVALLAPPASAKRRVFSFAAPSPK